MAYPKFEDLQVWQKARDLAGAMYISLKECEYPELQKKLQKVPVYIMTNIAKGYERQYSNEFDRFLNIARGYCGELKSTLYLAEDLGCMPSEEREALFEKITTISKMLSGLIKKVRGDKKNGNDEIDEESKE